MHSELTVKQNLYFSARVRLSLETSQEQLHVVVAQTLELLQLEHVKNTLVGDAATRGVSGGQRKRVNIGIELVAKPSVLFLDVSCTC